jgi:hypothetical protein
LKDDIYTPIEILPSELLKEAESNAKANLDGGSGRFHKNFLMFLEMAKDTFSDKRIPSDDMDKVIYGLGFLLNSYTWLKDRDPETLQTLSPQRFVLRRIKDQEVETLFSQAHDRDPHTQAETLRRGH